MTELVFATNNANKRDEVAEMLRGLYTIKTLSDMGITEDIPEDADTLEGNARLKAKYIFDRYKINVFADDTGLEVEALNGAPGVYSARYAGQAKSSDDNIKKLLFELRDSTHRKARFRTSICLIIAGKEYYFEGIVDGEITHQPSGAKGFGYDPVFRPNGRMVTFAEMTSEEKNAISHRGQAVGRLVAHLRETIV